MHSLSISSQTTTTPTPTQNNNNNTITTTTPGGFVLIWFSQLPFSSVRLILHLLVLVYLLIQPKLMRNSEKACLPYFCRSGQRDTSLEEFDRQVEGWLPLLPEFELPRLTGQMLADVVQRKSHCG